MYILCIEIHNWRLTVFLPVSVHNIREVKVNFVAGPIRYEWNAVTIPDLSANARDPNRKFRTSSDSTAVIIRQFNLNKPETESEEKKAQQNETGENEDLNIQARHFLWSYIGPGLLACPDNSTDSIGCAN